MTDEITLTLPRESDYQTVAHLVLGGLAARLDLTLENLEDLQLALGAVLTHGDDATRRGDSAAAHRRRCARSGGRAASARVSSTRSNGRRDELGLRRMLESTVDDIQVDGGSVRLTKRVVRA